MADKRQAGKGMTPKKGYNAKKWNENYDNIDWTDKSKPFITVKIEQDGKTYECWPAENKKDENGK